MLAWFVGLSGGKIDGCSSRTWLGEMAAGLAVETVVLLDGLAGWCDGVDEGGRTLIFVLGSAAGAEEIEIEGIGGVNPARIDQTVIKASWSRC